METSQPHANPQSPLSAVLVLTVCKIILLVSPRGKKHGAAKTRQIYAAGFIAPVLVSVCCVSLQSPCTVWVST